MKRGWFRESHRHSLAARGIITNRYMKKKFVPRGAKSDIIRMEAIASGETQKTPKGGVKIPLHKVRIGFMSALVSEKENIQLNDLARGSPEKYQVYIDNLERIEEILRELQKARDDNFEINIEIRRIKNDAKLQNTVNRMKDIAAQVEVGVADEDVENLIAEYRSLLVSVEDVNSRINVLNEERTEVPPGLLGEHGELVKLRSEQVELLSLDKVAGAKLNADFNKSLDKVQRAMAGFKGPSLLDTQQPVYAKDTPRPLPGKSVSITGGIKSPFEEGKQPRVRSESDESVFGFSVGDERKKRQEGGPERTATTEQLVERLSDKHFMRNMTDEQKDAFKKMKSEGRKAARKAARASAPKKTPEERSANLDKKILRLLKKIEDAKGGPPLTPGDKADRARLAKLIGKPPSEKVKKEKSSMEVQKWEDLFPEKKGDE